MMFDAFSRLLQDYRNHKAAVHAEVERMKMFGLEAYWDRKAREATEVEYLRRRVKVLEEERDHWKELVEDFLDQLKKINEDRRVREDRLMKIARGEDVKDL